MANHHSVTEPPNPMRGLDLLLDVAGSLVRAPAYGKRSHLSDALELRERLLRAVPTRSAADFPQPPKPEPEPQPVPTPTPIPSPMPGPNPRCWAEHG